MLRILTASCLIVVLSAGGAARGSTVEANPCNPDGKRPRVLMIGDSNMFGVLGRELQQSLEHLGFDTLRRGKSTSGLARPDYYDWMSEAPELLDAFDPDAVVMIFGGNDGQNLIPYEGQSHKIWWQDEANWREEYGRRVTQLMRLLNAEGRKVFLMAPTNRRPRIAREKMLRVIQVQRSVAARFEDVVWIDTYALSSDRNGRYLSIGYDSRGRLVNFRRSDGIHLTPEGSAVLRDRVVPSLLEGGLTTYCSQALVYRPQPQRATASVGSSYPVSPLVTPAVRVEPVPE